jgi:hypothetical protein
MPMEVKCPEYYEEVRKFAKEKGILDKFMEQIDWLSGRPDAVCILIKDFSPYSFEFVMYTVRPDGTRKFLYNGGLIYYEGSESGVGGPQFSVTLSGRTDSRWEIHT